MERKTVFRIVIFNLILSSIITLDILLPGKEGVISELNSIYGFTAITGSNTPKPKTDDKIIMEVNNGERFRIGKAPIKVYDKGQKIIIIKSFLSNNVNKIKVLDKKWEIINVGLFSNNLLLITFLISITVNILNIYIKSKALNIVLVFSMMFTPILFAVYYIFF